MLEIRNSSTPHHTAHTTHAARRPTLLRGRCSRLCCLLQKRQQVGALLGVLYASERHFIARNEMLRISDPVSKGLIVPNDVRGFEGGRIPAETREPSGLSIPQICETWPCHVLVWLQRMTSRARAKYALASGHVACRKS